MEEELVLLLTSPLCQFPFWVIEFGLVVSQHLDVCLKGADVLRASVVVGALQSVPRRSRFGADAINSVDSQVCNSGFIRYQRFCVDIDEDVWQLTLVCWKRQVDEWICAITGSISSW